MYALSMFDRLIMGLGEAKYGKEIGRESEWLFE